MIAIQIVHPIILMLMLMKIHHQDRFMMMNDLQWNMSHHQIQNKH